jgi:hypothetical protein
MTFLGSLRRYYGRQASLPVELASAPGLSEIIDFQNFRTSGRLRSLISSVEGRNIVQPIPSGEGWLANIKKYPKVAEVLSKALKDSILVDIGCSERWSSMHKLAKLMNARLYVAVDQFWPVSDSNLVERSNLSVVKIIEDSQCNAILIKSDALEFLSKLKSASCCIALNAIDACIMSNPQYHERLAAETQRSVTKGGAAFGILSLPLTILATNALKSRALRMSKNPFDFQVQSLTLCASQPSKPNSLWEDHSLNTFERLLIRR